MDSVNLEFLLSNINNSKLKNVIKALEDNNKLCNKSAVKLIIWCCTICSRSGKKEFAVEDLVTILRLCSQKLDDLNDNLTLTYLQSLYHIVKYLIEQKDIKTIITLEELLIPTFITNFKNDNTYANFCKLIHNFAARMCSQTDKVPSEVLDLCTLSIHMFHKITLINVLLQGRIYDYFSWYSYIGVDVNSQLRSYKCVLKLIENEESEFVYSEEMLKSVVNLLIVIINNCFKQYTYDNIREAVTVTVTFLSRNTVQRTNGLVSVIEEVSKLVCEENLYPESTDLKKILLTCFNNLKSICNLNKITTGVQSVCVLLYTILFNLSKCYMSFKPRFFDDHMTGECLVVFCKLLVFIGRMFSKAEEKCSCLKCCLKTDITSAVNCILIIGKLLKDCGSRHIDLSDELLSDVVKYTEEGYKYVKELYGSECAKWQICWKEFGTTMFNLSIVLHNLKNKFSICVMKLFIKYLIYFEGTGHSVIRENILCFSFGVLADSYIFFNELKNAMIVAALNVYLCPNDREKTFMQWIRAKCSSKDSMNEEIKLLQHLNLVSALKKHSSYIKTFYSAFKMDDDKKRDMLEFELRQYKSIWPSKTSMISTCREISVTCDVFTTVNALIQAWGDVALNIPEQVHDVIFDTLNKFEKELENASLDCEADKYMLLAYLYYIQYSSSVMNIRKENLDDMNNTIQNLQPSEPSNELQINSCDIIASYKRLNIDEHVQIMKFLHKSLHIFTQYIPGASRELMQNMNIYNLVQRVANEYRLHCYTLEYLQAWGLNLRVARTLNNKFYIIESIGHLVEKADIKSDVVKEYINEADNEILILKDDSLGNSEMFKNFWEILVNFYIHKSSAYLKSDDIKMSLTICKMAREYYDQHCTGTSNKLLKIRLDYLWWQHLLLPCEFEMEGHSDGSLATPYLILNEITNLLYSERCENLILLFEIYQGIVHMYTCLLLPREIRCYSKVITQVAQQLVIPLRSAIFLGYLAQADILSCRFDDARVKIQGICDILCFTKQRSTTMRPERDSVVIKTSDEVTVLCHDFEEMMLDFPSTVRECKTTSGSPILQTEQFKLPTFINHHCECDCCHCMNIDFQDLVLMAINLQGLLSSSELHISAAQDYYKGALCVYNHIITRELAFREKVLKLLGSDMFPDIKNFLLQRYCSILLNIGNNLIGSSQFSQVNKKLLAALEGTQYTNIHLFNEGYVQLLNFAPTYVTKSPKRRYLSPVSNISTDNTSVTPENKYSKVKIPVTYSPKTNARKCVVKNLKFNLEKDDDDKTKKSPINAPHKKPVDQTPTPLSKFTVYNPDMIKTTRKKKVTLPVVPQLFFEDSKNGTAKAPVSPSTSACSSSSRSVCKTDTGLKMRTKLLTEKIKKTVKVPLDAVPNIVVTNENNDDEYVYVKSKNSVKQKDVTVPTQSLECKRISVRNKKLAEISSVENNPSGKGAIRKSTRSNRK